MNKERTNEKGQLEMNCLEGDKEFPKVSFVAGVLLL